MIKRRLLRALLVCLQLSAPFAAETCSEASIPQDTQDYEGDAFSALQAVAPMQVTSEKAATTIPKIVHHIYKYDISSSYAPWPNPIWEQSFTAWKTKFPEPEYTHMFWSDARVLSFVENRCPKYHKAFIHEKRDIVRADFSRYCILWRLGGIYADLDYEPLQNFYNELEPGKVNLVQSPYISETYQNSLMASPPNHFYWEKLMDLAQFTMNAKNILLAAGPQLLDTIPLTHDSRVVHGLSCNAFQRATHTWDDRERQASLRKNCKLLKPADFSDLSLKGIHWGTATYDGKPSVKGMPELPVGLTSLFAAYRTAQLKSQPSGHRAATLGAGL